MWRSFHFQGRSIVIRRTGDVIPLDPGFLQQVARVATYICEIGTIVASRPARDLLIRGWTRPQQPKIAFLPRRPAFWYAIWSVCRLARINIVDNPADADLLFYFEDIETRDGPLVGPCHVINGQCTDITKSRVAAVFEAVFGYGLAVDPTTHHGPMVSKSEKNGVHDGRVLIGPLPAAQADQVYQRVVDATKDGVTFTDHRTYVVGGRLSVVFLKSRHGAIRFSNDNDQVEVTLPHRCFSEEEQARILDFASALGLEFGGMDILRDRTDGRIYIVDVNKTDLGPPIALKQWRKRPVMQRLARDFRDMVDTLIAERPAR